jgi:hypothetical protein
MAHEVTTKAQWDKWDKAALQAIFGGGILFAALTLIIGVVSIVTEVASGQRLLSLPVNETLPATADAGTAVIVDGHYDAASVLVSNISTGASVLITAASILLLVSNLLAAVAFLYLVWRLLRREPFIRSLTWTFVVAGAVLLIGSLIGQVLLQIANLQVMSELGATVGGAGIWATAVQLDAAPLALGFILMLVGAAFEFAQKLAADTKGLV